MIIRFTQHPTTLTAQVQQECVLLNEDMQYFQLDATGSIIWDLLAEPQTIDAIATELTRRFEVDEATAARDAGTFVAALQRIGCVSSVCEADPLRVSVPDHVLVEIYPHVAVLLNTDTGACFELDRMGSVFWQAIENQDLNSGHVRLCRDYDADPLVILADLVAFCERLAQLGFLILGWVSGRSPAAEVG